MLRESRKPLTSNGLCLTAVVRDRREASDPKLGAARRRSRIGRHPRNRGRPNIGAQSPSQSVAGGVCGDISGECLGDSRDRLPDRVRPRVDHRSPRRDTRPAAGDSANRGPRLAAPAPSDSAGSSPLHLRPRPFHVPRRACRTSRRTASATGTPETGSFPPAGTRAGSCGPRWSDCRRIDSCRSIVIIPLRPPQPTALFQTWGMRPPGRPPTNDFGSFRKNFAAWRADA
jgi:hypothetical protein